VRPAAPADASSNEPTEGAAPATQLQPIPDMPAAVPMDWEHRTLMSANV
jgi:hypothetical protein